MMIIGELIRYADTIDLFDNPVGCRTSLAKCSAFCCFEAVIVRKLKFPNNSNRRRAAVMESRTQIERHSGNSAACDTGQCEYLV